MTSGFVFAFANMLRNGAQKLKAENIIKSLKTMDGI